MDIIDMDQVVAGATNSAALFSLSTASRAAWSLFKIRKVGVVFPDLQRVTVEYETPDDLQSAPIEVPASRARPSMSVITVSFKSIVQ
jgi:hypothetical protein